MATSRHSVAVVDAKYKRETPAGYPEADVYQMLAYCTALHLRRGHLVSALGGAEPARHLVRHAGVEIVCHALDLALPPAALLATVSRLADQLVTDHAEPGCTPPCNVSRRRATAAPVAR